MYSNRDKSLEKTWPKGTAETMQVQLNIFENTIYEMYQRLLQHAPWPGQALEEIPGKGAPHVHDIVIRMGCMPSEEEFVQIRKTHGRFADGKGLCKKHETVGDGSLRRASGGVCGMCVAEEADGKIESKSPSQAAPNVIRTIEFTNAAHSNGHRHIEQQSICHPNRPRHYPTPETEEQSAANSAAISRQPSHHASNSHGNPMDMNGWRHHSSGLADSNYATPFGFPPLEGYNNMEQELMLNSGMQHLSYGAHMGAFNPNHGFGNLATPSGAMDSSLFDLDNTNFGVHATGNDPMHVSPLLNADGSLTDFRNPDVEARDPFMGESIMPALSPQMRARGAQERYRDIMNPAGNSANRPNGAISPAMSAGNRPIGGLEHNDQLPPDLQHAGSSTGRSQGNQDDNPDLSHFFQASWDETRSSEYFPARYQDD